MKILLVSALFVSSVVAWGAAGHQIVATIAQILLTDKTRDQLCDVLPDWAHCHLAPVAAWADQIKRRPEYRGWSGPMHYINAEGDFPSKICDFGSHGWHSPDRNIALAINNYTKIVDEGLGDDQDIALRFLVHYIGDLHQPLHLAGRASGGNGIKVRFEHRLTNLHSVWDGGLITKAIREIHNYSLPLPEKRIEDALQGAIYDPYIRWIAKEGLLGWWKSEYQTWAFCPGEDSLGDALQQQTFLRYQREGIPSKSNQIADDPSLPVCPLHWATPLHKINCEIAFPAALDDEPTTHSSSILTQLLSFFNLGGPRRGGGGGDHDDLLELNTPEYAGRIRKEKIMEKLLAMGGVRLAAVLNDLFDPPLEGEGARGAARELEWY